MPAARNAALVMFSTISAKEALRELVLEYETACSRKIDIPYTGEPDLARRILDGLQGDLFIDPEAFSTPSQPRRPCYAAKDRIPYDAPLCCSTVVGQPWRIRAIVPVEAGAPGRGMAAGRCGRHHGASAGCETG